MMDISNIIESPSFSKLHDVKRVTFALDKGRLCVYSTEDIKIPCAITPNISATRHMSDFNLEYVNGKIAIYSRKELFGMALDKVTDNSVIDFVYFNKVWWQVEEIRTWQDYGYIIAYAKMYETQAIFEELNNELYSSQF